MNLRYRLASAYLRAGKPFLPVTRGLRAPLRFLFHLTPTLAHDRRRRWKPYLIRWSHELLVGELPADFRIHRGEIAFRSVGSEMAVQGYYVGEIEAHLMKWIEQQLRPDFLMLDIGAHHGAFTLVVAHELRKRGWKGKVYAFEPDQRNYEILQYNILQNRLEEYVELRQMAMADKEGRVRFNVNLEENSDNRLAMANLGAALEPLIQPGILAREVDATCLDTIGLSLARIDLVKMDTQGAEYQVLSGGRKALAHHKPPLLLELLSDFGHDSPMRKLLEPLGYEFFGVTRKGALCSFGDPKSYVSWDCCCLHRDGSVSNHLTG